MKLSAKDITRFQKTILGYYESHKRDLPWRNTRDPYAIMVSEVMLQQTQAERAAPFFAAFMKKFPTPQALAQASTAEVLKSWQGLGYNRRALNLKRAAEIITNEHAGNFPATIETIDALPGVGPYTAGAIGAFAFGIPSAFIETNIRTVYLHFFFRGKTKVHDEALLKVVEQTLPDRDVRGWYNALMDYGAMLKATVGNPNIYSKSYTRQSKFKGSRRELRGAILRLALQAGRITPKDFLNHESEFSAADIISELVKEGFLKKVGRTFRLG